jgi:hypothetical protein
MPSPEVRAVLNADEAARFRGTRPRPVRGSPPETACQTPVDASRGFGHEASILPLARARSRKARVSSSLISTLSGDPATAPPDCSLVIQAYVSTHV